MKPVARPAALRSLLQPSHHTLRRASTRASQHLKPSSARRLNADDGSQLSSRKSRGPSDKLGDKVAARSRHDSVSQGHDPRSRVRLDFGKKYTGRHAIFRSTVLHRFQVILNSLSQSAFSLAGIGEDELNRQAALFMNVVDDAFELAEQNITRRNKNSLFWNLREAFIAKDIAGLTKEIQYSFQSFVVRQRFSKELESSQNKLLDFRFPHEWFPATRALQRTIHVHVGPTNSGKTYHAIKALENSKRGIYAGPLRLLATEVYQRLNSRGFPCALITGEEIRIPEDTDRYFMSCTVEMVPLNRMFDVAVIDEIQMIADPERGHAWTSALLGVQAKEVHICGEERAVTLIQQICASIGDECVVHRYERLSPLTTMKKAVDSNFANLEKGDCVVAFSRLQLHALKRNIERRTGRRCAIVYGALPPEVRVQQAALFNDPNNDYDFIVASDAIGMGLNLEIRRVVFESVTKFDGAQNRILTSPEIKQIGGRAGRYRTARTGDVSKADGDGTTTPAVPQTEEREKMGYVTSLDQADLQTIHKAFVRQSEDISAASIEPPESIVQQFASYFPPETPLSFILMRIKAAATVNPIYALEIGSSVLELADLIQDIPLPMNDRAILTRAPINKAAEGSANIFRALARIVSENLNGDLLSIPEIPIEVLDLDLSEFPGRSSTYLFLLESLHNAINCYLWLSYRFSGTFRDQALGYHVRSLVEQRLIETLERMDFTEGDLAKLRRKRRFQAQFHSSQSSQMLGQDESKRDGGLMESDEPPVLEEGLPGSAGEEVVDKARVRDAVQASSSSAKP